MASVAGISVPSVLNLNCQRTFKKPLVIGRRGCIQRDLNGKTIWMGAKNLAPARIRYPDRPARFETLYELRYPGPPAIP